MLAPHFLLDAVGTQIVGAASHIKAGFIDRIAQSLAGIAADPTVYHTMNGPSEFHCVGSLRSWNIIDQLKHIRADTLLISGRHDEATAAVVRPFADRIPRNRWVIFENSSHMPHVEETAACLATIRTFLESHDA